MGDSVPITVKVHLNGNNIWNKSLCCNGGHICDFWQ